MKGFSVANPFDHFYRPIEQMVLAAIQMNWGWDTFPIRIIHLLLHAGCALLAFHVLREWKVSMPASITAVIFIIISQLSAYAVLSNNTFSQLSGTLFSGLSLWLLYRYLTDTASQKWKYSMSVFLFFLALLSKETLISLPLGILLIITVIQNRNSHKSRISTIAKQFFPYCICILIYIALRIQAGSFNPFSAQGGNSFYSIAFGTNIIKNIGLFAIQAILPVSTLTIKKAIYFHNYSLIAVIIFLTAAFACVLGYGLRKSPMRQIAGVLILLVMISWLPAVFLNHDVGENYAYNMIIYLGVLFGIAFEYYRIHKKKRWTYFALSVFLLVCGVTNILGVNEKALAMKKMGERAKILFPQILSYARNMPEDSWIYLINPPDSEVQYTKFSLRGFDVLDFSDNDTTISYYSQKHITIRFAGDDSKYEDSVKLHSGVALTYDPKTMNVSVLK